MIAQIDSYMVLLMTADIVVIMGGIILGIVFGIKAHGIAELPEKKSAKRIMWWSFLGPIAALVLLIVIHGFDVLYLNTPR